MPRASLSEGFMARVFESRHLYSPFSILRSPLNIGLLRVAVEYELSGRATFHRQRPGFGSGLCALFDRSASSVPAGCPEPYLYDRLFSGSEIAVGGETASAK
jgi:hypothetical protein